jgi:hypothetical protein
MSQGVAFVLKQAGNRQRKYSNIQTEKLTPIKASVSIGSGFDCGYAKISRMALCTPLCTLPRNWQEINKEKTALAKSLD